MILKVFYIFLLALVFGKGSLTKKCISPAQLQEVITEFAVNQKAIVVLTKCLDALKNNRTHAYYFLGDGYKFADAQKECEKNGWKLPHIGVKTKDLRDDIFRRNGWTTKKMWLGASITEDKKTVKWLDGTIENVEELVATNQFCNQQPNHKEQLCLQTGLSYTFAADPFCLNDMNCDAKRDAFCEIECKRLSAS